MKLSDFHVQIGTKSINGIWAAILAIVIAIPILALVGVILAGVFSIVGVIITIALGIAGIAIIIGLLSLLIPKSWREKLGIHVNFSREHAQTSKPKTTPDGKPIIDVDFEEENK
ncbi:hypothetical protein PBV87_02460 [Niameybacter massiliensis]|uniref:Uncharacterized protein n=1 Tax=Holtiella tumoricola TaxID=3018743 RepID=A0AA42IZ76_9FIRM|nr:MULTISPECIES: hypothetical protein [Lachnospirales]MDA3730367.1 hypothetical protein [Holtiella tumoricola]